MSKSRRIVSALLMGATIMCISTGCSKKESTDYYQIGMEQLKNSEYEKAIASFNTAIEKEQRLPESYRGMGIAALDLQDYPSAIAAFSRSVINMDEENAAFEKDVKCYLASARYDYGEEEKAIETYNEILEKYKDPQCYYLRGKAYLDQKEYELAKQDFDKATKKSKDYDLFISIYQAYADCNMTNDGDAYLEAALNIGVEDAEDYYNRGRIYYCLKDYKSAKSDLIQAMNAEYKGAVLLLGKVYLAMDDVENARAMYQEYVEKHGESAQTYNGFALCDIAKKDYAAALANIQKGIEIGTENEIQSLLYNEIIVYEYQLDFTTAKEKMKTYLEQYPTDEVAVRENEFLQSR